MNKISAAFVLLGTMIFSGGATYILTKAKYEKLLSGAPAKTTTVKEESQKSQKKSSKGEILLNETPAQATQEKGNVVDYAKKYMLKKNNELIKNYTPEPETPAVREYVDEDIFQSNQDYTTIQYTFWSDDILTDENDEIIDDPEATIGIDAVETFNQREVNGIVYVLNHAMQTKYEITRDLRRYSEVIG